MSEELLIQKSLFAMATQTLVNDGKSVPFLPSSCQKDSLLTTSFEKNIMISKNEVEKVQKVETLETPQSRMEILRQKSHYNDLDEETELSSCFEESDSDFSENETSLRLIETKWELERYDLAWRWGWLKLQISDLEQQVHYLDQLYEERRSLKPKFQPLHPLENGDHCIRTAGISKPKKCRKVYKKAPTTLSARNSVLEGFQNHPLFSFPEKKKKMSLKEEKSSVKKISQLKLEPTTPNEEQIFQSSTSSEGLETLKLRKKKKPKLSIDIPSKEDTKKFSPLSGNTPTSGNSLSSKSKNQKRSYLRTRDFDIGNIVIPYNMTGNQIKVQPKLYKEISTPTWRDAESISQGFLICSTEQVKEEESKTSEASKIDFTSCNIPLYGINSEVSEEDTSDEFYASKHLEKELQEMKHRLVFPQKKSTSFEELVFPTDLISSKKIEVTPDLQKIKDIILKAKENYLNSPKFQKDWLDGDDYGNEYYFLMEEENAAFEDLTEVSPYEIVKKDPPLDPETNKERHIIYLKKIST